VSGNPYPKSAQLARREKRYRRKVVSERTWQRIMDAKRGPCRVCKGTTTHLPAFQASSVTWHHVIPRDFHGDDVADNIVPLCFTCHELVTAMRPQACLALCASLTDAEYAYAIGKLGEGAFERVYRVTLT
jgi:5-methylcytosine-specific restriction endonuclease McrA